MPNWTVENEARQECDLVVWNYAMWNLEEALRLGKVYSEPLAQAIDELARIENELEDASAAVKSVRRLAAKLAEMQGHLLEEAPRYFVGETIKQLNDLAWCLENHKDQ